MKTITQLCKELVVPRQTLQGWIDEILDKETHKTGQGIAQRFGEEDVKKIRLIKKIKDYNSLCKNKKEQYSNSDIKKILYGRSDDFNLKDFQEKYIAMLKKRREECDRDIEAQEAIMETGVTPEIIFSLNRKWNYAKAINYLSLIGKNLRIGKRVSNEYDDSIERTVSDGETDILIEALEALKRLYAEKYSCRSEEVQLKIGEIYKIVSKIISGSVILFEGAVIYLAADEELSASCDETLFFIDAAKYYCANMKNLYNETDKSLAEAIESLYKLCLNKKSPSSDEAQQEVERLCGVLLKIEIVRKGGKTVLLKSLKEYFMLRGDEYIYCRERRSKVYIFRYIANAFQFYCEHCNNEN